MSEPLRVLHLLREGEERAPEVLHNAAAAVHTLPAGSALDEATRFFMPQIVTVCAPFDPFAREAVDQVVALGCPVVGFGKGESDWLAAAVSSSVSACDLAAILALAASLHSCEHPIGADDSSRADLERNIEDDVRMLEHLMNLRIPGYQDRSARILDTCLWIGNHLCLQPRDLKELSLAARLREIGKLGLPDALLFSKRNSRTPEQQQIYDAYTSHGASVLSETEHFRGAGRLIGHLLENFDGTGPERLFAHQIPLGSRILRVAAACEMIRADYGNDATVELIVDILNRGSGSLYDSLLIKLFENYADIAATTAGGGQTQKVRVSDLIPGMVLAQDMWSRTGMKIIAKGTVLSEHTLRILLHHPIDPALETIEILRK